MIAAVFYFFFLALFCLAIALGTQDIYPDQSLLKKIWKTK